ncbi:MAG: metallophosphoesterase [Bacteroidota bacterium]|jgi:predicted MPP superfamily phosphohydrolase|nr:metallophosphoesterase [Ignavibacteria bacterium]MCU7512166.1 metallophosphoesterase [Ignavibacteria bacterium]MCU7520515.1 metallophosphoesterase [Ignavibacteria bacterium]MCU7523991.1 metallophosphoesterase [Ignavibacteria bacterium]
MGFILRIILAVLLFIVLEIYFYKRITSSLRTILGAAGKNRIKTGSLIFLILLNLFPLYLILNLIIIQLTNGRPYSQPQGGLFDYFIFFPFIILELIVVQSLFIILPIDLLRLIIYPFIRKQRERARLYAAWITAAITAAFIIYVPARIIYDFNTIEVRHVELKKAGLPESLKNFRITFISDTQADPYTNKKRLGRYIERVNETKPDLVLVGGDVITSSPDYINLAAEYLGDIRSRLGVYSCVGDHDNWAYRNDNARSLREVSTALKEKKVDMLDNQNKIFNVGNAAIGVTFVTSTYVGRIGVDLLDRLTDLNHSSIRILLTHQPSQYLIDRAAEEHYDLLLAGHTHGGQITFLFPFHNFTFTQFETPYVKGDFHIGNMLMVVTRGLGMSIVPFRYNSTPEITVITLRGN